MPSNPTKREMHQALVARILDGAGDASPTLRRAAFDNTGLDEPLRTLIRKMAMEPTQVADDDIAEVISSGLAEDQVFELVICAAVGQSTRQYEAARAALDLAATTAERDHAT